MSSKLIATVGDQHTCPMVTGNVPHVGGTIISGGKMLLNGRPVARMGDKCVCTGCGVACTIVQGDASMLVDGQPVAYVGCMTSHGGVITTGQSGVVLTAATAATAVTMPLEAIDFPDVRTRDRVAALLSGQREALAEAKARQREVREASEAGADEARDVTIASTYPLDELSEYARQFGASFFSYALQSIFGESRHGEKVPLHAYEYLYRDLSDGKLAMPTLKIHRQGYPYAFFRSADATIHVAQRLVIAATEDGDPEAMGKLYMALMEEFGHYVDHCLRNDYTCRGGDAKLDEGAVFGYCLTTFNVFEDSSVDFGTATVDGASYDLRIDLSELQAQVSALVTEERVRRDEQAGGEEYFSAGKVTYEEAGGYTHYGIEEVLRKEGVINVQEDLEVVYLGNLLRDWSQLITPATERYTEAEKRRIIRSLGLTAKESEAFFGLQNLNSIKLRRETLSFVIELIAAHELIDIKGELNAVSNGLGDELVTTDPKEVTEEVTEGAETAVSPMASAKADILEAIKEKSRALGLAALTASAEYFLFRQAFPKVTSELVGVCRPEEHIDNPIGACVVDLERDSYVYWPAEIDTEINEYFGMKDYIRNYDPHTECETFTVSQPGVKYCGGEQLTASGYLTVQLRKSFEALRCGDEQLSLLYFGNAMHTIEDYFAHSNFVELSLIKVGYGVFPWVNRDDPKARCFRKQPRDPGTFDYRPPGQDYFDRDDLVEESIAYADLAAAYPGANRPFHMDPRCLLFEEAGLTYEYAYEKTGTRELYGRLRLLREATVVRDAERGGDYLRHLPIVTGKFGPLDMIYSLSDKLEAMFDGEAFSWTDVISSAWEDKLRVKLFDLMMLTILRDLKHAQASEERRGEAHRGLDYAELLEWYERMVTYRGVVFGVLEALKRGKGAGAVAAWFVTTLLNAAEKAFKNVVRAVVRHLIAGVALGIRESQNAGVLDTNPTHTQVAKDDMGHPLHGLAGELARTAVADIGRHYVDAKDGLIPEADVERVAREYLSHPSDVSWMDVSVLKWAGANYENVREAEDNGAMERLQRRYHRHREHLGHGAHHLIDEVTEGVEELDRLFERVDDLREDLPTSSRLRESLERLRRTLPR